MFVKRLEVARRCGVCGDDLPVGAPVTVWADEGLTDMCLECANERVAPRVLTSPPARRVEFASIVC